MRTAQAAAFFDELSKIAESVVARRITKLVGVRPKRVWGGGLRRGQPLPVMSPLAEMRAHQELLRGKPVPSMSAAGEIDVPGVLLKRPT